VSCNIQNSIRPSKGVTRFHVCTKQLIVPFASESTREKAREGRMGRISVVNSSFCSVRHVVYVRRYCDREMNRSGVYELLWTRKKFYWNDVCVSWMHAFAPLLCLNGFSHFIHILCLSV
jgi:hypothetical protein